MPKQLLFLTLRVFSATGGIEKVSMLAGKALYEIVTERQHALKVYSMYDKPADLNKKYFPAEAFKGFGEKKMSFVFNAVREGIKSDIVFISHINLLSVGFLIKQFSPKTKLVLLAHGIEIWSALPSLRKKMLAACDLILPVSQFTKEKIVSMHGFAEGKCRVLNNCLDPFLPVAITKDKDKGLLARYGLRETDMILYTLTRLSTKEQYKGYDTVLKTLVLLKTDHPNIKYLIVGKYDEGEKKRVEMLIKELDLENNVVIAGFIPDAELAAHFTTSDIYIMPSKKEGFGIVFIEAMYYGKPVIAGNKDGSVDALCNGALGSLVNPDDVTEIRNAINQISNNPDNFIPNQEAVLNKFGFDVYKRNLKEIIGQVIAQ